MSADIIKFQYPSSRVILPDMVGKDFITETFGEFQYPSSRVILPDQPSKTVGDKDDKKSFNTPVVGWSYPALVEYLGLGFQACD